jgi:hypothetical protein
MCVKRMRLTDKCGTALALEGTSYASDSTGEICPNNVIRLLDAICTSHIRRKRSLHRKIADETCNGAKIERASDGLDVGQRFC